MILILKYQEWQVLQEILANIPQIFAILTIR
jgi:hypothetical protein